MLCIRETAACALFDYTYGESCLDCSLCRSSYTAALVKSAQNYLFIALSFHVLPEFCGCKGIGKIFLKVQVCDLVHSLVKLRALRSLYGKAYEPLI